MSRRHWTIIICFSIVTLGLSLWRIEQPIRFVSDEWYFVQDAQSYARNHLYTDAHPPLGKMQIAAAIAVFGDRPFSWRLPAALSGTMLVVVGGWVVWLFTKRPRAAAIAAGLLATSGWLTVESRLGLINLPYVLYGLVGFGAVLAARQSRHTRRWLMIAGTAFGLALSVKWLAALFIIPALGAWFSPRWLWLPPAPIQRAAEAVWWLVGWPLLLYLGIFFVHFAWLGTAQNTLTTNLNMLAHHFGNRVGHIYRELWWRWPLAWQPFPYWSEIQGSNISAMWFLPNPIGWWLGWGIGIWAALKVRTDLVVRRLLVCMAISWLPFAGIHRDMFLYHAIPLAVWLSIFVAIITDRLWERRRTLVIGGLTAILIGWAWFLPWYLNLPLSQAQHQLRQLLPAWYFRQPELDAIRRGDIDVPPSESRTSESRPVTD